MNGIINFFAYNTTLEPSQVQCLVEVSQSFGVTKIENLDNHSFSFKFNCLASADGCLEKFQALVGEWDIQAAVSSVDTIDYPCE